MRETTTQEDRRFGDLARDREDSLSAAKKLLAEEHSRSSISRAYYAAYSVIAGKLTEKGVSFPRGWNNPAHEQLPALLRNTLALPNSTRYSRLKVIRFLRDARGIADYKPGYTPEFAIEQVLRRIEGSVSVSVAEEEVSLRNSYWCVPIRPSDQPHDLVAFTEFLADLEGELQDDAGLNITLTTAELNHSPVLVRPIHLMKW
jgi:hypothetical protein